MQSKKYVQHPSPCPLPFLPLSLTQTSSTPIWNACMSQLHKEALYAHPINTNIKSHTSKPPPQRHMKRKHGHRTISPNIGDMKERSQHSHQYQSALRIRPLTSHADIPSSLHHKPTTTSINAACNLCIHNILLQLFL